MRVAAFLKAHFCEGGRPTKKWVEDQVYSGEIPGVVIGGEVFIDERAFKRMFTHVYHPKTRPHKPKTACKPKNPLLEAVRNS